MGVKRERDRIYRYKDIYNSITFFHGEGIVKFCGKIEKWENIEIISRIFYKKLEELLYTKKGLNYIYEKSLTKIMEKNNLSDKNILDIFREKKFHLESMNILIMKIFDYIYYNIKTNLPYVKTLSMVTGAVSELLENTFKYASGEFSITAGLRSGKYPLVIKIENGYDYLDDKVKTDLLNLQKGIDEINSKEDPEEAFATAVKDRVENESEDCKHSRLGFAKIRMDTNAKMKLALSSSHFGEKGITLTIAIPIRVHKIEDILEKVDKILKL